VKSESGQAIVEYLLLLSILVGIIGFFVHEITGLMDSGTAVNGAKIETQLRTGEAPATIWTK